MRIEVWCQRVTHEYASILDCLSVAETGEVKVEDQRCQTRRAMLATHPGSEMQVQGWEAIPSVELVGCNYERWRDGEDLERDEVTRLSFPSASGVAATRDKLGA